MKEELNLFFYHDTRIEKLGGVYPVKLALYRPRFKKKKLFRIGLDLTEAEFEQGHLKNEPTRKADKITGKAKKELEEKLDRLKATESRAKEILAELHDFSFYEFENRFYNKAAKVGAYYYFEAAIQKMKSEGRVRTAETYTLALKKLKEFANLKKKKPLDELPFEDITSKFLFDFERWLATYYNHTESTIGIYIRPLRTVFNTAIADKNSSVKAELYPFGGKQYTPPSGQNVKKALTAYQLKQLFEAQPENKFQEKAKDFWFFSYLANGINFKDIAELKFGNINGNRLFFYRSKTKAKTKAAPVLIQAVLPEFALNVLKKYGKPEGKKEEFVFDIISPLHNPEEALRRLKGFTRFVNQHMKKLAEGYNKNLTLEHAKAKKEPPKEEELLPADISTYWARHSFTTQAIRKGASMELLQESLGHKNLATTQNYFAGFTSDVKDNLAKSLLEF
jgi:site-specific recombinase XerD